MHSSTERQRCSRDTAQVSFLDDLGEAEIQPRFRSFSFLDDLGRERRAGGGPRPKGQSGRTLELRLARGRRLVTRGVRGRAGVNDIAL